MITNNFIKATISSVENKEIQNIFTTSPINTSQYDRDCSIEYYTKIQNIFNTSSINASQYDRDFSIEYYQEIQNIFNTSCIYALQYDRDYFLEYYKNKSHISDTELSILLIYDVQICKIRKSILPLKERILTYEQIFLKQNFKTRSQQFLNKILTEDELNKLNQPSESIRLRTLVKGKEPTFWQRAFSRMIKNTFAIVSPVFGHHPSSTYAVIDQKLNDIFVLNNAQCTWA